MGLRSTQEESEEPSASYLEFLWNEDNGDTQGKEQVITFNMFQSKTQNMLDAKSEVDRALDWDWGSLGSTLFWSLACWCPCTSHISTLSLSFSYIRLG